ncbi:hypothetical protein D9M73_138920 [compost metagenome]
MRHRVFDRCNRRHVRCTAQTCFVGEHATLHAHDNGAADQAAESLVQTEGALDDGHQHVRHLVELQHDHVDGHADVRQGFHRHQQVGDLGDALDPADEHQAQQYGQADAGVSGVEAERVVQRVRHSVSLQAVEGEAERHQQQERHEHAQPAFLQTVLDVVGRAATEGAVGVSALVQLTEGAFEEAAGHADQCGHPHPEHRARPAECHGDADTGNVARTDAAGEAEHQGLE